MSAIILAWGLLAPAGAPPDVASTSAASTTAPATTGTLELDHVLAAVERAHPGLGASERSVARADASALSARGAFDPRLRVRAGGQPASYYEYFTFESEVRARTVALGLTPFVAWRLGRGDIPIYDGRLATASGGELRAGFELPLLRNAAIDAPRAQRAKADLARGTARAEFDQKRLELLRDATSAYWDWVAAGLRAEIRAHQLELARARDAGIRRQIDEGNTAAVEALDNERVIATREVALVGARRDVGKAALDLSLFLWHADQRPRAPAEHERPSALSLPPPLDADLDADVEHAVQRRPELRALGQRLRQAELDVRLARNQRLPSFDAQAWIAKDLGTGPAALMPVDVGVAAVLELPIPLRSARGELAGARAERRRLEYDRAMLRERIAVEVRTAHLDMQTARARAELAHRQAELAERLAEAERARLALGDSTILVVNLREEAAAAAAEAHVDALADYRKARARYQVATGRAPVH
ncbi:MAG: TolC family protein [Nannocystaceae bacterium]|nr:TolC family protein [Nannocystaceae bacterium]